MQSLRHKHSTQENWVKDLLGHRVQTPVAHPLSPLRTLSAYKSEPSHQQNLLKVAYIPRARRIHGDINQNSGYLRDYQLEGAQSVLLESLGRVYTLIWATTIHVFIDFNIH